MEGESTVSNADEKSSGNARSPRTLIKAVSAKYLGDEKV